MRKTLIFIILTIHSFYLFSQDAYLIKDKDGFDFLIEVTITNDSRIEGFTRTKALLDYTTKFKYNVVKLATKLKYPEIIRFSGIYNNGKFEGDYNALFSTHKISGRINLDTIYYSLTDNGVLFKEFKGLKVNKKHKKDYVKLAKKIIYITEQNIFNPNLIQTKKWEKYKTNFIKLSEKTADDLEFQIGSYVLAQHLGFSHFYLSKKMLPLIGIKKEPKIIEINKNTVVLEINSFEVKKEKISLLLDTIRTKNYSNLIIDLRNNPGGNFGSTSVLGDFLTSNEILNGFFPNRNWYNDFGRFPNINDIDKFELMTDSCDISPKYGFYIKSSGSKNHFSGNIYILTNKNTGSAAEAIAITAKEYNLAKLIGGKTNGGLLRINRYDIDDDITLIIPVNDFISAKGFRVEGKGVEPDFKTPKGKELYKALKLIGD